MVVIIFMSGHDVSVGLPSVGYIYIYVWLQYVSGVVGLFLS